MMENNVKASRLVLLLIVLFISPAFCHTYVQVGVNSNFLVYDGKVAFAQSDGTLTVINLETGDVVARKKNIYYDGTLKINDIGIFVTTYSTFSVLNKNNLEIVWQANDTHAKFIEGDKLVTCDGNGLVKCRDLISGKTLWSYDLPGALQLVFEKGKILIFMEAVYDGPKVNPAVVLLDLVTGKELLHRTTPAKVHFMGVFFDGDKIYLQSGQYEGEHIPTAKFERLIVWDLEGNELESTPVTGGELKMFVDENGFEFGGKFFSFGSHGVWKSKDNIPSWQEGRGKEVKDNTSEDNKKTIFNFGDANVIITVPVGFSRSTEPSLENKVQVVLKSEKNNWQGFLSYLKYPGKVVSVELTDSLLLLGTDFGHVEAVDLKTGQSKWMYIFPTKRQTMSYSSYGMPPMMASAAKTYERENEHKKPESGLVLVGSNKPSSPKVTFDPEPASNPYGMLTLYLVIAWSGILIPIGISGFMVWYAKKYNFDVRASSIITILVALVAFVMFFNYGRVSIPTAFGFKGSITVPLIVAIYFGIRTIKENHRIFGGLVLFFVLLLGLFISPAFFRL
jgi:outer membrane protein assembly factor BamB